MADGSWAPGPRTPLVIVECAEWQALWRPSASSRSAAAVPALRARPLEHVNPALSDHGDTQIITRLLRRLDQRGT